MWRVSAAARLLPLLRPSSPWRPLLPIPDDSVAAPKSPWGINIIKKNKKAAPRAFGVRLEECQPATENQVRPHNTTKQAGNWEAKARMSELQGTSEAAVHLSCRHSWGSPGREQQS